MRVRVAVTDAGGVRDPGGSVHTGRAAAALTRLGVSTQGSAGRVAVPLELYGSAPSREGECRTRGWGAPTGGFGVRAHGGAQAGVLTSVGAHRVTHGWVSQRGAGSAQPPVRPSPGSPGGSAALEPPPRAHGAEKAPAVCFASGVTHSWQMWHPSRGAAGTHPRPQYKHPTRAAASPRRARARGEGAGFTPRCSSAGDSFSHRIRR